MRLRNLFMILLLCMTVGMFGVSCTGDDGAQGPKGDTGEQGAPGQDGADAGDSTEHYGFLKMWGSKTGDIACDDPLLSTTAAFPRTEPLDPIHVDGEDDFAIPTATDGTGLNAPITVVCGSELFGPQEVKAEGNVNVADDVSPNGLVFVKTGRAAVAEHETARTPQNDIDPATKTTTSKKFVGGYVVATQNTTGGSEEPLDRRDLYRDCQKGTPPPGIRGDWQGVQIIENTKAFRDGGQVNLSDGKTPDGNTPAIEAEVTTTKVCVRLDSHPGVVKCFIDVDSSDDTKDSKDIALYDAEKGATSLMKLRNENAPAGTLSDEDATPVGVDNGDALQHLFGNPTSDPVGAAEFSADDREQLCNLFEEGLNQ